ncbi:MAG: hypothetical protein KDC54_08465 [Lewinella sp.]|nr:hypothetical protein [Lewinella sp.]
MEQGILTEVKESELVRQMVEEVVSPKGYNDIKANVEDFETPARLTRQRDGEEESFIPDATGVLNGRKSYFELALKTDAIRQVVTKWQLMSSVASYKRGKLFLVVPRGHFAFTNRLLNKYPIEAEIIKMD